MNIPAWIEFPVPLIEWMCRTTLEASVLIVFYLAIRWLGGRWLNPHWMRLLGLLVVARLLMPVVPPSALSVLNLAPAPPDASPAGQVALQPAPLVSSLPMPDPPARQAFDPPPATAVAAPSSDWTLPLAWGWLTVVVVIVLSSLISRQKLWKRIQLNSSGPDWRLRRLLRTAARDTGVRAPATLLITPAVHVPALFGWWRPRFLLPAGLAEQLTDSELGLVLRHELIHLKRRDVFWNWIGFLALALHWINPLAWLAVKGLRADQELACDSEAVAGLADDERNAYGALLLNLAVSLPQFQKGPGLAPIIRHPKEIHRRIQMIARYTPSSISARLVSGLTVLLLVCVTFTRAADPPEEPVASPTGEATDPEPYDDFGEIPVRVAAVDEGIDEGQLKSLKTRLNEENERVRSLQIDHGGLLERYSDTLSPFISLRNFEATRAAMQREIERSTQSAELLDEITTNQPIVALEVYARQHDPLLAIYLEEHQRAANHLWNATRRHPLDHPNVDQARQHVLEMEKAVHQRVEGIREGLRTRVKAAEMQLFPIDERIASLKAEIDAMSPDQRILDEYRAKIDQLERAVRIRAAVALRITHEELKRESPLDYRASVELAVAEDREQTLRELWGIGFAVTDQLKDRGLDDQGRPATLDIKALPNSDSIRVTVLHRDEKTAEDIARAITAAYLKHHRNARVVTPANVAGE